VVLGPRLSQPQRFNGQPISGRGLVEQLTVHSDAGDLGWGLHTTGTAEGDGWEVFGTLEDDMLGASSTAREISGLMAAAAARVDDIRGKRVCFRMDSYPAMRNLVRGGGPVPQLNGLVRQWWNWCDTHAVRPTYEWVPREENTKADELSKRVAQTLQLHEGVLDKVREWLDSLGEPGTHPVVWKQTVVHAPVFDMVVLRRKQATCMIVPVWPRQPWWPLLTRQTRAWLPLGPVAGVAKGAAHQAWEMEARLLRAE
jgi:hypothetical protein